TCFCNKPSFIGKYFFKFFTCKIASLFVWYSAFVFSLTVVVIVDPPPLPHIESILPSERLLLLLIVVSPQNIVRMLSHNAERSGNLLVILWVMEPFPV